MSTEAPERRETGAETTIGRSVLSTQRSPLRTYRPRLSNTWWLRNRRYFMFMLRDFSVVPITLWLIALLLEISRLGAGPDTAEAGYYAYTSPRFVVFSVLALAFALLHSITWLSFSGIILRVRHGGKSVDARIVSGANFALWAVASVLIGAALILLGT